jgi:hypothetical protein
MSRTLVIILGNIRAHKPTFDSFKKNVIDTLNADLCLCVGIDKQYDYDNPYHKLAKYRFYIDEPSDYVTIFEEAFHIECERNGYFDILNDRIPQDALSNLQPHTSNTYATYVGDLTSFDPHKASPTIGHQLISFSNDAKDIHFRNQVFLIRKPHTNLIQYKGTTTFLKHIHWRQFLTIKDQWLGGIKDQKEQHPGTAGLLLYYRWAIQQKLISEGILESYDRFYITRCDYIHELPIPSPIVMTPEHIWIPDGEGYHGFTDRQAILSRQNIIQYLNIFSNMVSNSHSYFTAFKTWQQLNHRPIGLNLEQTIMAHLTIQGLLPSIRHYPYTMFTVREPNGQTNWSIGKFDNLLGLYIKYPSERASAQQHKISFARSGLHIDDYYRKTIRQPDISKVRIAIL